MNGFVIKTSLLGNSFNDFYEEVKATGLQNLAVKAGLLTGCDIKLLKPQWQNAKKVLDVGSAFGRVIGSLLDCGFKGEITGIERNNAQYQYAKEHYGKQTNLIHSDINDLCHWTERFDVIFFLWSGLADFSPTEQPEIIKYLAGLLNKEGKLIIDTMPMDVKPLNTEEFAQRSF